MIKLNLNQLTARVLLLFVFGSSFGVAEVSAQTTIPQSSKEPDQQKPVANAQAPAVFLISDRIAQAKATQVKIFPGRSSIIDFRNGETVTYIELANQERIVYHTNAPVESGQARLITTRLVDPLKFEGQTRPPGLGQRASAATNLIVSTTNRAGEHKSYIFDLLPATDNLQVGDRNGVAVVPHSSPGTTSLSTALADNTSASPTVQTSLGLATLADLKRGLKVALDHKYSLASDPIVYQVKECIALAHNGTPLLAAANQLGIPASVIVSLGEMGIADHIRNGNQLPASTRVEHKPGEVVDTNEQTIQPNQYFRKIDGLLTK